MRTRKWKESGGFFEAPDARERNNMGWRYCLTVQGNPVEGADDAYHDGSWGGDPGNYDVNIYLRRVYDCDDPSGRAVISRCGSGLAGSWVGKTARMRNG